MQPQPDWPHTLEEFRAWHERQPDVSELIEGTPRLMAPDSKAHTLIKSNAGRALGEAVRGTGGSVLVDGAIVEVENSSLIPDVLVTCAPLDLTTPRVDQPVIIVEINSPSSETDDSGHKLSLYLKVASLRHYLVIHQDRRQIVHHERRDDLAGKFLTSIAPADPVRLDPPGIDLSFGAVCEGLPLA